MLLNVSALPSTLIKVPADAVFHHLPSNFFLYQSQTCQHYTECASSYRSRGLRAPWEHLALQLEHAQVDVGGGCGRVDVSHHLQSLQDVLVLLLPVASHQSVRVTVGR